jgi:hypothetical protein
VVGAGYSDRIMFEFSACTNVLAVYGQEIRRAPGYHLVDFAQNKPAEIHQESTECRKVRKAVPSFNC